MARISKAERDRRGEQIKTEVLVTLGKLAAALRTEETV